MRLTDRLWMSIEGVFIALDSLRANKVRAALTISGVAVGVFVVVAMGATVHGIRMSFQKDMDEFGTSTSRSAGATRASTPATRPTTTAPIAASPASPSRSGRPSSSSPRWTRRWPGSSAAAR